MSSISAHLHGTSDKSSKKCDPVPRLSIPSYGPLAMLYTKRDQLWWSIFLWKEGSEIKNKTMKEFVLPLGPHGDFPSN